MPVFSRLHPGPLVVTLDTAFKSTVRFLLTAVLVLPGGGFTELRHAHPGGAQPHDHPRIARRDPHRQDDSGVDHDRHLRQAAGDSASMTSCFAHVHISCFGFHFTCPSPTDPQETDDDSQGPTIGKSFNIVVPRAPAPSVVTEFLALVGDDVGRYEDLAEPASARCCKMADVTYLCDTARHERSGVQLI
jgi:hypothetical protein